MENSKKKLLIISDDLRSTSGVGMQTRFLVEALVSTGKYTVRQIGAALKHQSHKVEWVHPEIAILPVDGFGDPDMLRRILATEKPDALIIFTDPRFFGYVFHMHDEIQQICPIIYNHLWDQCEMPPTYNKLMYECVDYFHCLNYPTYEFVKSMHPEKVSWTPHALPSSIYCPLKPEEKKRIREFAVPEFNKNHFIVGWLSRNAHRKRSADVIWTFKKFLDKVKKETGKDDVSILMHTDPHDVEGPSLKHIVSEFGLNKHVIFSTNALPIPDMKNIYNCADVTLSMSYAEGFGLSVLESLYCGVPVIATETGGMTRQIRNFETGEEYGKVIKPITKKLVGHQEVPFIIEDIVDNDQVADALFDFYQKTPKERSDIGKKGREYVLKEFSVETLQKNWDESIEKITKNYTENKKTWRMETL